MRKMFGAENPIAVCTFEKLFSKQFSNDFVDKTGHDKAQMFVTKVQRSFDSGAEIGL